MPHADTSYFPPGLSKEDVYKQVLDQARGLLDGQRNWVRVQSTICSNQTLTRSASISNSANISSLLWHAYAALPLPSSSVNWAGFYIRDDKFPSRAPPASSTTNPPAHSDPQEQKLLLGPFHGKPACQLIVFGKGVCGTAALKQESLVVDDVLSFPGHIACDADSRSEIVVPVVVGGETVAIIDVDCAEPAGFDDVDRKYLEQLAALLGKSCDW